MARLSKKTAPMVFAFALLAGGRPFSAPAAAQPNPAATDKGETAGANETSRAPEALRRFAFVNLAEHFNAKLDENFHAPDVDPLPEWAKGNNLSLLPQGEQVLGGISFQIGDGLIHLGARRREIAKFPREVGPIDVGEKCTSLHFLHAVAWARWVYIMGGSQVGEYLMEYEDGQTTSLPIVVGVNTHEWTPNSLQDVPQAVLAWRGETPSSRGTPNKEVNLYATSWSNPTPDKAIKGIVFRSDAQTRAAPFCLAITVDRESEGIDYLRNAHRQDVELVEGAWKRVPEPSEQLPITVARQEMELRDGKAKVRWFGDNGNLLLDQQWDYRLDRHGPIRVMQRHNIRLTLRPEGRSERQWTAEGPIPVVFTLYRDQLAEFQGTVMGISEGSGIPLPFAARPAVVQWSRESPSE